jgi:hypothetical protein
MTVVDQRRLMGKEEPMKDAVLYVHVKGGSAAESDHYKTLFPSCKVTGLDYPSFTPWEAGAEIRAAAEELKRLDQKRSPLTPGWNKNI